MNNLEMMRKRLEFQGGIAQDKRMIRDKYRTFLQALKYSYQGCNVRLAQDRDILLKTTNDETHNIVPLDSELYRALINPDKLKQDYDDKLLSIDYNTEFKSGDVFTWQIESGPLTQWIIYLQAVTEDAYFKGEIRRCRYIIKFKDEDGNICATYAAIRGPVETKIESIQKNQIRIDVPNLSLNILIPNNPQTKKLFKRYSEFMFDGKCWRVQAPDSISMEGVLEINAEEYYKDRDTDTDEVKDGLIIDSIKDTTEYTILGNSFIKPKIKETYKIISDLTGTWSALMPDGERAPVKIEAHGNEVEITWTKAVSCNGFDLIWTSSDGTIEKRRIVVESLF